jgi:hypothetical protein
MPNCLGDQISDVVSARIGQFKPSVSICRTLRDEGLQK